MRLNIHVTHHFDDRYYASHERAGGIERVLLGRIIKRLEFVMATLEQVLAAAEAQRSSVASIGALLAGIKKQLDEALGGQLTPSQQMRVDAIFNRLTENTSEIDAAIKANDGVTDEDEKMTAAVEVASSASPANVGDTVVLSAQVTGEDGAAMPTGEISFTVDGNVIGTGALDAEGVATYSIGIPLTPGEHEVVAHYSGDGAYRSGDSEPLTQTISAGQGSQG